MSSDDNILDEFPQTQELMSEQYVSKNKKEIRHSHSVSPLTGKNSSCNILQHEPIPSSYAKREYNHILSPFTSVCQNLLDTVHKRTNAKDRFHIQK